jgi:hypothetical protein
VIQLKNDPAERGDYLRWKWTNGTPLPKADFGDPDGGDALTLCCVRRERRCGRRRRCTCRRQLLGSLVLETDAARLPPARAHGRPAGQELLLVSLAEGAENRPPKLQVRSKGRRPRSARSVAE